MQSLTETDLKLEDNLSKVVDSFKVRCMCLCALCLRRHSIGFPTLTSHAIHRSRMSLCTR